MPGRKPGCSRPSAALACARVCAQRSAFAAPRAAASASVTSSMSVHTGSGSRSRRRSRPSSAAGSSARRRRDRIGRSAACGSRGTRCGHSTSISSARSAARSALASRKPSSDAAWPPGGAFRSPSISSASSPHSRARVRGAGSAHRNSHAWTGLRAGGERERVDLPERVAVALGPAGSVGDEDLPGLGARPEPVGDGARLRLVPGGDTDPAAGLQRPGVRQRGADAREA